MPSNPRLNALAEAFHCKSHEDASATQKLTELRAGVYSIPATSLVSLARQAAERTRAKTLRAVGDPAAIIQRVAMLPGYMTDPQMMEFVRDRNVDAVVCGEACQGGV